MFRTIRVKPGTAEEMASAHYSLGALPSESEGSPFKRHPFVSSADEENDMNNPLERDDAANHAVKPLPEIITFPNNEARTRAVTRLLRLFTEAKMDPRRVGSISKKFIGALARNNALPPPMKQAASNIAYRGSLAIPLPGKRAFDRPSVGNEFANEKSTLSDYPDMTMVDDEIE